MRADPVSSPEAPANPPPRHVFHVRGGDEAVPAARARIVALAATWDLPLAAPALDDLRLCASEVIANALKHAGGECWITSAWTGTHLRVSVADGSPRPPVLRSAGPDAVSGRGLAFVAAFAASWGWEAREIGKAVHFEIAGDPTAPTGG